MELEGLMKIAALIALISFMILSVYLIVFLRSTGKFVKETKKTLNKMTNDFGQLKDRSIQIFERVEDAIDHLDNLQNQAAKALEEVSEIKEKAEKSLENFDSAVEQVKISAESIDKKTNSVINLFLPFKKLSDTVYSKIAPPVYMTSSYISAVTKAISVFTNLLSGGDKNRNKNST